MNLVDDRFANATHAVGKFRPSRMKWNILHRIMLIVRYASDRARGAFVSSMKGVIAISTGKRRESWRVQLRRLVAGTAESLNEELDGVERIANDIQQRKQGKHATH